LSDQRSPDEGPQPAPDWLIPEHYDDVDLGVLKEGKEAVCSLVQRTAQDDDRSHLLVRKQYRSVKHRAFRNDAMYRHVTGSSTADKAIRLRTDTGLAILNDVNASREFDVLSALWAGGHPVPYPVSRLGTELLLEFLGDDDGVAAPRLVAARLSPEQALAALDTVLGLCADMLAEGWVHGDLSPFNVLWHDGRAYVIDFPQTMDLSVHAMALDVLHRDVTTMCDWVRRRGASPPDPDEAFAVLLSSAYG
jgi:RIO kinase 1